MGLPDISKVPKKDPMGMDYIPVYEGEDEDGTTVKLSAGKLQRIGVKTEPAALRVIAEPVRAPGAIQLDERRIAVISLAGRGLHRIGRKRHDRKRGAKGPAACSESTVPRLPPLAHNILSDADSRRAPRQRLLNFGVPPQVLTEIERTQAGADVHHLDRSA